MHEATLLLKCEKPEIVAKSLEQDLRNDSDSQTKIKTDKSFVVINIKSEKLSHLKAIINSCMYIIAALEEVEKLE